MKTTYLLTGDIGGTNSRMSLYSTECGCTTDEGAIMVEYYRNQEHLPPEVRDDPDAFAKYIIVPFLKKCFATAGEHNKNTTLVPLGQSQIYACLATAGLVMNNSVRMTNLGYLLVDGTAIQRNTTDEYLKHVVVCRVINDFVAQGYGCLTLQPHEIKKLFGPVEVEDLTALPIGPKVCVGAGTGLGECYLTPDEAGEYSCFPSEGGHVEYAPRNELEAEMWSYLLKKFEGKNRISVERVVSGPGLANVYEFLAYKYPDRVDAAVQNEFLTAGDEQGKVVAVNAKPGTLCHQAMSIMMGAYGCEVGSAAIKWIPVGGLFVTGGLTPKNIQFIEGADSEFMKAYLGKGRVSPILERIPCFAVMVEDLGVRGVHKAAKILYEHNLEHETEAKGAKNRNVKDTTLMLAATAATGVALGILANKLRR